VNYKKRKEERGKGRERKGKKERKGKGRKRREEN
jgi:hypothetical protein